MAKLVIVESPAKAKTIGKYLGKDYEVTASMGHIRDLPKSQLGIDVEHDYAPQYINIKDKSKLIKELKKLFPGCIVMKSDSGYLQGIPDLLILFNDKWAALECKQHAGAKKQPNQEYYVGKMDEMSFSRFICPENKEEVLHDLQQSFQS